MSSPQSKIVDPDGLYTATGWGPACDRSRFEAIMTVGVVFDWGDSSLPTDPGSSFLPSTR